MSDSDAPRELRNMAEGAKKKPGCCRRHPVACGVTLLVVGAVSLAVVGAAIGIHPFLQKTFKDTVEKQVELVPHSEGTSEFKQSSAPLYTKFYFFNVTNADDVSNRGAHPVVAQCGPYTYREWRTSFNLEWTDNETVVHYDLNTTYTLERDMSSGDPTKDTITTLNIPLYVFLLKIKAFEESSTEPKIIKEFIDFVVKEIERLSREIAGEQGIFMKIRVDQLLFGYNDPLLKELKKLIGDIPFINKYADLINPFFGLENRTGIERANAVYTGKDDINKVGEYVEWNGNFEIYEKGGWGTRTARMINGTGGYSFHPDMSRHENVTSFISELFRSGYFSYTGDKILYGITLYRFTLPGSELVSANQDPGFYPNGPNGVLNLTAVFVQNAPIFASKPHFLDADPGYRDNVTGLVPDRSIHDSNLDIEPITGAAMRAAKRIQINLRITRYDKFVELENIMPELMMPVFWASEEGQLTKSLANKFKKKVYGAEYGMEAAVWGAVGLGGLVFLLSSLCVVGLVVQQCRYRRSRRPRVEPDEETRLLYSTN